MKKGRVPALPRAFLVVPPMAGRQAKNLVFSGIRACAWTPNRQLRLRVHRVD